MPNKRAPCHAREGWAASVSDGEAARRAGGRRAYNAWRRMMAEYRRYRLVGLAAEARLALWSRGTQTTLAARLGVSRSTISRGVAAITKACRPGAPCPVCGCAVRHLWPRTEDDGAQ